MTRKVSLQSKFFQFNILSAFPSPLHTKASTLSKLNWCQSKLDRNKCMYLTFDFAQFKLDLVSPYKHIEVESKLSPLY